MGLENVPHRRIRDFVTKIGQGALNAIVAPAWILAGHFENKLRGFFFHATTVCQWADIGVELSDTTSVGMTTCASAEYFDLTGRTLQLTSRHIIPRADEPPI